MRRTTERTGTERERDRVVAGAAGDRVDAVAADQRVVRLAADQGVVTGEAGQDVAAAVAGKNIVQRVPGAVQVVEDLIADVVDVEALPVAAGAVGRERIARRLARPEDDAADLVCFGGRRVVLADVKVPVVLVGGRCELGRASCWDRVWESVLIS